MIFDCPITERRIASAALCTIGMPRHFVGARQQFGLQMDQVQRIFQLVREHREEFVLEPVRRLPPARAPSARR